MDAEDIRTAFAAWGRGDVGPFADLLADDVVLEFPGSRFGGRFEGKRKVTVFLKRNQRMFDGGLAFDVSWVGLHGDKAVAQWTNRGTTREGVAYANRGVTVFTLASDRVVEIQDYLDTQRLAETWPQDASARDG